MSVFINRLPIGALLTFIFFSTSLTAYAESGLEKLERYDRVSEDHQAGVSQGEKGRMPNEKG